MYHAFGDAYTISSQLSNPPSAKQMLFLPHALKETTYPSYGFQECSHNISNMCTIIVTSLSVSLSWEQLYFSCISCTVIRSKSLNAADAALKKQWKRGSCQGSLHSLQILWKGCWRRGALTKSLLWWLEGIHHCGTHCLRSFSTDKWGKKRLFAWIRWDVHAGAENV